MTLPNTGWKGHGRPGFLCDAETATKALQAHVERTAANRYRLADLTLTRAHTGPVWQPIETAPRHKSPMIVVRGVFSDRGYVTDPWCVFWQEGAWQRWPHKDPPTHWCQLPPFRPRPTHE